MVEESQRDVADRHQMVDEQLKRRDIRDERVLEVMRKVPRHLFVPPEHRHLSYFDGPLPIGEGQTISQPYIVALMTQLLMLTGDERVLEIGTGSGYQAAILGYLAKDVYTVEIHSELAEIASMILLDMQLLNVSVHVTDGSAGLVEYAPYDAIIATAAAPSVPRALLDQLADGGRLVLPVGGPGGQMLERWFRRGSDYEHEAIVPVAFVPLRGEFGWKDRDWFPF